MLLGYKAQLVSILSKEEDEQVVTSLQRLVNRLLQ